MTALRTRRRALAIIAAVIVVGVLGYAFRSRRSPAIGRLLRSVSATSAGDNAKMDEQAASPAVGASTETSTPRGEVSIDPRRQQLIGVKTVPVTRGSVAEAIRAVGLVRYDETRLADVNVKVDGWIRDLYVDYTGQSVRKGQPLFTLFSPDMLTTENEFLLALKTREQLQQSQIADARNHAEQLVGAARERLRLWDLSDEQIAVLEQTRQAQPTVEFRSPFDGVVTDKQAIKGMHVMPGQTLYKLADLSVVWLEADVYENDIRQVRLGAQGAVTLAAYPTERFTGRAVYIGSSMDEKTRTVKVRFEFVNRAQRLKPGMYANVEVNEPTAMGLLVPTNAVLDSGKEQVVFVALGNGYFEPHRVKTGRRLQDAIEITDGVKEGDQVATGATFVLDSESQLRASLQGYEPPQAGAASAGPVAQVAIAFRSIPDPPKAGDNQLEVVVKDPTGKPINDAQVDVQFFMAAMPTMNMPAMHNGVTLSPVGSGTYRGTGQVMMAGRWDATVVVTRGGQRLGTKQLPVIAR
jgi:RND family efflux transporter MFP subunit